MIESPQTKNGKRKQKQGQTSKQQDERYTNIDAKLSSIYHHRYIIDVKNKRKTSLPIKKEGSSTHNLKTPCTKKRERRQHNITKQRNVTYPNVIISERNISRINQRIFRSGDVLIIVCKRLFKFYR